MATRTRGGLCPYGDDAPSCVEPYALHTIAVSEVPAVLLLLLLLLLVQLYTTSTNTTIHTIAVSEGLGGLGGLGGLCSYRVWEERVVPRPTNEGRVSKV